ncbi:luciferin 4-monooxygenase-like [Rhipicephalus sanguineus]|uniref:luciferin 4-monooxygenase-like n=1 Tax=Rhipicephalus sanguineus TaxID=34632 RepID=UPI0020C466CC|nr:luciferin 4-monooxygenase-like [Rhipicephalus sanguineus]
MEKGLVKAALQGLEIPDLDFGAFIRKSWIRHGEKTAVVDDATGTSCTYVELERQCWSVAAGMHSLGFVPGDVAAFASANSLDLVVAVFGAIFAGGKVTFVKTNLTEREVEEQLSKVSPMILFADTQNAAKVAAATKKLTSVKAFVVFGEFNGMVQFEILRSAPSDQFQCPAPRKPDDDLFIFYTSGTTGHPKGALITNRNYIAQLFGFMSETSMFTVMDAYIGMLPFSHPLGFCVFCTMLAFGAKTVALRTLAIERLLMAAQKYKNSMLLLYPTYIRYLIEAPIPKKLDLSDVRAILIGGSTTPAMYLKKLSKMFPRANVVCGYGLTEVSAAAVYCRRPCDDSSCLGPPVPFLEMKVVDVITNQVLGPRECGEICIRGPTVFKAYLNMPEATAKAFDEEGFFRTGDTGYFTADGHFHVAGRIKDLIKCMDQQVAPAELETLLLSHPDVREVVVTGVPHSEHGEAARAFVVLRKDCQGGKVVEESLKTFVKDLVAYHKQLHGGLEFLDELPATETGKALRRELRDAYLKRIAATTSS